MRIIFVAGFALSCLLPACAVALDDTPITPYMAPAREEPHAPPPEPHRAPAKSAPEKASHKK